MASNDSHLQKSEDFWNYLEENYKEVSNWPSWMKGEGSTQSGGSTQIQCPSPVKAGKKVEE